VKSDTIFIPVLSNPFIKRPVCANVRQILKAKYSRRIAYPVDEPESVKAKTTVDQLLGRDDWQLPTLHRVDDNRAASLERLGQLTHGTSAHRIEDETKFLPIESILNILL
jgi:hypothetical protein